MATSDFKPAGAFPATEENDTVLLLRKKVSRTCAVEILRQRINFGHHPPKQTAKNMVLKQNRRQSFLKKPSMSICRSWRMILFIKPTGTSLIP